MDILLGSHQFQTKPLANSRLLGLVLIGLVLILGSMIANGLGLLGVSFEIQTRCQNPRDKLLFGTNFKQNSII